MYSPCCSLYKFCGTHKENLFNNQELLLFVISSLILVTLILIFCHAVRRDLILVTLRDEKVNFAFDNL